MFTVKTSQAVTKQYNLAQISMHLWPEEAKIIARNFLSDPKNKQALYSQEPGNRTGWLIAQIEAINNIPLTDI